MTIWSRQRFDRIDMFRPKKKWADDGQRHEKDVKSSLDVDLINLKEGDEFGGEEKRFTKPLQQVIANRQERSQNH